jgi:cell division protein FtsB
MIAKSKKKKSAKIIGLKRLAFSPLFFAAVFVAIGGSLFFSNLQMAQRRQELSGTVDELSREIADLGKKNAELKTGIDSVTKETFLEKQAREIFQLKKPGEKVVVIVSPQPSSESSSPEQSKNWWQQILEKLGL